MTTGTFHSKVAGVSFKNDDGSDRQDYIRSYCRPGINIILKREPDNPYDSNAVAVWVKGNVLTSEVQIGYLKAEVAEEIADYMDSGGVVEAQITEVTGGTRDKQTFGVNILLTKARTCGAENMIPLSLPTGNGLQSDFDRFVVSARQGTISRIRHYLGRWGARSVNR